MMNSSEGNCCYDSKTSTSFWFFVFLLYFMENLIIRLNASDTKYWRGVPGAEIDIEV